MTTPTRKAPASARRTDAPARSAADFPLLRRLRRALAGQPAITEQRMFGSVGVLCRGHLLAGCREERVLFRVGAAAHEAALRQPGVSAAVMGGKVRTGYVHVAAEAVATDARLQYWVDLALACNAALPPK